MRTPSQDNLQTGETNAIVPARKHCLKCFLARLSIWQILRDEHVYEVHGPFIATQPEPPRLRLAAWMIAKLAG